MSENFKFNQNKKCEYFPCHKVKDDEQFNCLFCFCPLFWIPDCGGNPTWRGKVKDCTGCTKPHMPGGYEHVIARLKERFTELKETNEEDES